MTRYGTKGKNGEDIFYGYDHACGYFLLVYSHKEQEDAPPILDIDSTFDGLTGPRLSMILADMGCYVCERHYTSMMADLPF